MEQSGKIIDKRDFCLFHQKNVRLFYHLGLKFIDDIEVMWDIVRKAFIAVWQRYDEFKNEMHMKAFLYTAIRNRCMNYLRDRQVEQKNGRNYGFGKARRIFGTLPLKTNYMTISAVKSTCYRLCKEQYTFTQRPFIIKYKKRFFISLWSVFYRNLTFIKIIHLELLIIVIFVIFGSGGADYVHFYFSF